MTDAIQAMNAGNVDPYLLATLQTYNPNFKGTQNVTQTSATQVPQVQQSASVATDTGVANLPQADYSEAPDSSTGSVLGLGAIAIGAGALIIDQVACKGKHRKKLWDKLTGMFSKGAGDASKKVANKTKEKLEGIRVRMVDGKPVYNIAGKTTTETNQTVIQGIVDKDKKLARQLQSIRYGTGETVISAGTFTLKEGNEIYHITFEGDKIKKILKKGNRKPVTNKYIENGEFKTGLNDKQTAFVNSIKERISKIKSCDKDVVCGKETNLRDFTYITTIGDTSATYTRKYLSRLKETVAKAKNLTNEQVEALNENELRRMAKELIENPETFTPLKTFTPNRLTTLTDFSANSEKVIAHVSRSRANGTNLDPLVAPSFVKDGKLPEGYKVEKFILENGGNPIKVVNGKVEGITINGRYYGKDTDKCIAYLERDDHKMEKAIKTMIEEALKDNKIPNGATIVPV